MFDGVFIIISVVVVVIDIANVSFVVIIEEKEENDVDNFSIMSTTTSVSVRSMMEIMTMKHVGC